MRTVLDPRAWWVALLAVAGIGCGSGSATGMPSDQPFIALQKDFQGFQAWESFDVVGTATGIHEGPSTVYLARPPPHGSTSWPVGTLMVKVSPSLDKTFAMAKRGGEFNVDGARGWEWFELSLANDGVTWSIRWRGITPPTGEGYSGVVGGACNTCHVDWAANDYVGSDPLQLSNF
jgi:hypothetical protein